MPDFAALATDLIEKLGYIGLAIGLIIDSAGVPIPSEVLLTLAGVLVSQGKMDMLAVMVIGTLAQTVGAILAYWIGAKGGLPLIHRYGKYFLFSENELARTQRLFARYGSWITLAGRCLPGIRTYIGFPPGVAHMPFMRFAVMSLIGSTIWTVFLVLTGYYLADSLHEVEGALHIVAIIVAAGLVLGVLWYLGKRLQKG